MLSTPRGEVLVGMTTGKGCAEGEDEASQGMFIDLTQRVSGEGRRSCAR